MTEREPSPPSRPPLPRLETLALEDLDETLSCDLDDPDCLVSEAPADEDEREADEPPSRR